MINWTNPLLKTRARARLKGRWKKYLLIGLLYLALTNIAALITSVALPDYIPYTEWAMGQYLMKYPDLLQEIAEMYNLQGLTMNTSLIDLHMTSRDILWNIVDVLCSVVFSVFFVQVLAVGQCRWYMEMREGTSRVGTLFSVYTNGTQWLNTVWVRFCVAVRTVLWSLLFFLPGLVYGYKMFFVPYLLAENPYMSKKRAIQLSKVLTKGEKLRIFLLQLSFIGWFLLEGLVSAFCSALSASLGGPGLLPMVIEIGGSLMILCYMNATMAELYACMREKAFRMGYSDQTELAGFAAA